MCFLVLALLLAHRLQSFIGTRAPFLKKCETRGVTRTIERPFACSVSTSPRSVPSFQK
jgi:hypothetical protein